MRWLIRTLVVVVVGVGGFWLGRQTLPDLVELLETLDPAPTPHEAYSERLVNAGLDDAALGRLWDRAARRAMDDAPVVETPFREAGYLDPSRPDAVGYRFPARVGQRLSFALEMTPATNTLVFLDLYRADDDGELERVASADSGTLTLIHEPGRDAEYILRIQPELLRGGGYVLTATAQATLAFPVDGAGPRNVQSFFGDARDGGARDHHGVDIFAPRYTPVVAAMAGRVRRVRETAVGGRVVWLRDEERNQNLYYAHLQEQWVESGEEVEVGDTLGLVGNSGNAITTPPHLHFGIYRRGMGPVDPMPFVRELPREPPALAEANPGEMRRVTTQDLRLRAGPSAGALELDRLDQDLPVRVLGVAGEWLRVEMPDGRRGFLAGRLTEPAVPQASQELAASTPLKETPAPEAPEVTRLNPGERVEILGRMGDHLYVQSGSRTAWLPAAAPQ